MSTNTVSGHCEPAFAKLRETFEAQFSSRGEIGAAVAVAIDGELVVDLWGGMRDRERALPWERESV
ncbi:MAG: serine hydrolase, partial [Halieaceae bacterium]|nr:serine hydrolase [Halieaceae bacterium]